MGVSVGYAAWPLLTELLPNSFPGVQSKQDNLVVDIDRARLETRMADFFNATISDSRMGRLHPGSMDGTHAANAKETRAILIKRGYRPEYLVRYVYRPFDCRWIYWEPETKLLGRKSPDLFRNVVPGNCFIEARQRQVKENFDRGYVVTALPDNFGNGFSNFFPLTVSAAGTQDRPDDTHPELFASQKPTGPHQT
jgi:hypothetical protein